MKDIANKLEHIPYSLKHVYYINKLAIKYHVWSPKYLIHDMDKVIMYLFAFNMTTKEIHNFHRQHSNHHVENVEQKNMDWTMAVLDWECARFTKPDKPLNAYDTLMKYYPEYQAQCMPIIKKLNLI